MPSEAGRVYSNDGNAPLIELLERTCKSLLDVGCGAGDNARLINARCLNCNVCGITHSTAEAELAKEHMVQCWVFDIEDSIPDDLADQTFDALMFSHVLEHLRKPEVVLSRFAKLLRPGGAVLVAVPNILSWKMRIEFLTGRFEYEQSGVLDDTHLRFFTYHTADRHLLSQSPDLQLEYKTTSGGVPLWLLRRYVLPKEWCQSVDNWGCRQWPNLFGAQVLFRATKK